MRRLRVQLTVLLALLGRLGGRDPGSLPVIWGDPDKVEQILTNLVGNAIKYSLPTSDELAGSGR